MLDKQAPVLPGIRIPFFRGTQIEPFFYGLALFSFFRKTPIMPTDSTGWEQTNKGKAQDTFNQSQYPQHPQGQGPDMAKNN
jgi:hypothetical protein